MSSHPWLFAKSNVDCVLRLILCKSSLWCKLSVTFVVLLRNLVIDLWYLILKATIAEIIGNEEAMDLYRHTTELGSHVRNNSPNCENVRYFYFTISSSSRSVDDTLVMYRAIFVSHLEMKTRKQNGNNKLTEIERFDWFIERMQTRVAFGWLSERSGDKTSYSRTF